VIGNGRIDAVEEDGPSAGDDLDGVEVAGLAPPPQLGEPAGRIVHLE
jgi:hypothetical protein